MEVHSFALIFSLTLVNNLILCKSKFLAWFTDKDGKVSWDEFKKHHYTDVDDNDKEQMAEDEEKFKFADVNGDGGLDLKEYMTFYHPGVSYFRAEFFIF